MSTPARYAELIPARRFIGVLGQDAVVHHIAGDRFAVLSVQLDTSGARVGGADAMLDCEKVLTRRIRMILPEDCLITRLRPGTFGILAFGMREVVDALEFARRLHADIRAPVILGREDYRLSACVGIAFARPGVRPLRAMEEAEIAATRVQLNGGDATFVANPARPSGVLRMAPAWRPPMVSG